MHVCVCIYIYIYIYIYLHGMEIQSLLALGGMADSIGCARAGNSTYLIL